MNNRSKSILFVVVSAAIVTIGTLSHSAENTAKATFGGGCFWCMEPPFDKLTGVISTISGYSGGIETSPTYDQVSSGKTGHTEVVQVEYDPQEHRSVYCGPAILRPGEAIPQRNLRS